MNEKSKLKKVLHFFCLLTKTMIFLTYNLYSFINFKEKNVQTANFYRIIWSAWFK